MTWLLAALAGWALALWLLALAGMGGSIARLADDPSLAKALPQPRPPAPERLGPLAQYSEIGARPLFSEDRRPQSFVLNANGEAGQAQSVEFVLTSVLITPNVQIAIVQPSDGGEPVRMKLGEPSPPEAQGWRLTALSPRSATFDGPQGPRTLELRVFDGKGGQPPTAVAKPAPTAGAQPSPRPKAATAAEGRAAAATPEPPPGAPEPAVASPEAQTPEAQMEAIRKRIEARRAQMRAQSQQQNQQNQQNPPPQQPTPPAKTP